MFISVEVKRPAREAGLLYQRKTLAQYSGPVAFLEKEADDDYLLNVFCNHIESKITIYHNEADTP